MKFAVYDLNKDSLEVTVFDKDLFSPNGKTDGAWQHSGIGPSWGCLIDFHKTVTMPNIDFRYSDFLGCAKLTLKDLLKDGDSPWTKRLLLEDVASGEIELKIDLTINKKNLLLQ